MALCIFQFYNGVKSQQNISYWPNTPVIFTLEPDPISCRQLVKGDKRCQKAKINWSVVRSGVPIQMFDIGMLRFYGFKDRLYRTENYDIIEYRLKIRFHLSDIWEDWNRSLKPLAYVNWPAQADFKLDEQLYHGVNRVS